MVAVNAIPHIFNKVREWCRRRQVATSEVDFNTLRVDAAPDCPLDPPAYQEDPLRTPILDQNSPPPSPIQSTGAHGFVSDSVLEDSNLGESTMVPILDPVPIVPGTNDPWGVQHAEEEESKFT